MTRTDLILAILAAGAGRAFGPAQIQKSAFLASRGLPGAADAGGGFDFRPGDFGPYDAAVFREAEGLVRRGLAHGSRAPGSFATDHAATHPGVLAGEAVLSGMRADHAAHLRAIVDWVLPLPFATLVRSVAAAHPDMAGRLRAA